MKNRTVLVVEDDYLIAQDVSNALEQAGAVVLGPVPSVSRALCHIENATKIDAAVLDVNLGDENSFRIAEELRIKAIPFLFATGYNSADIPVKWQSVMVVMKPFRIAFVEQLLLKFEAA